MFFAGRPVRAGKRSAPSKARRNYPAHAREAAKARSDAHARAREARRPVRKSARLFEKWASHRTHARRGRRRQARRANGGPGGRSFQVNSSERFRTGKALLLLRGDTRGGAGCEQIARARTPLQRTRRTNFSLRFPKPVTPKGKGRGALRPTRPHARVYSPTDSRLCSIAPRGVRRSRTHTNRRRVHTDV